MIKFLKRFAFKTLSLENYLRLLQRNFLFLYSVNILRLSDKFRYHYYIKNFIKEGDIILDIGANLGYYSIPFAKLTGKSGKVYSVEPIKVFNKIFNEVAKKYNNIILYPYALGTEEKTIKLVSSPHTGYLNTGLPHVYDSAQDGKLEDVEYSFDAEMKIPSKLFGDLEKIDYIKCDIEGFEYVVLSEMKDIIAKHKPILQVEVSGQNEECINSLFKSMGYIPHKLMGSKLVCMDNNSTKIDGDYIFIPKK